MVLIFLCFYAKVLKLSTFDKYSIFMDPDISQPPINYDRNDFQDDLLLHLYKGMLKPRLIEEKMLILLRQGKISKWFSGIGQEAIAVGVTDAMHRDEYILPMHRNLGVFTQRDIPLYRLFSQWQGKANGFTKGRDRSFHFGTQEYKIVGMISHLGPQLGVANGIALAHKLRDEKKITTVYTGEGGTSEGDFHEALNIASVWNLPVLFCIENNGYGLSTPTQQQFNIEDLYHRGAAYGIESHKIDGNNILEVYSKISGLAESMRENPRPVLVEFKTFRMRGHEEASGTKYVPSDLLEKWGQKDPISNFKNFLEEAGILSEEMENRMQEEIKQEIDDNLKLAFEESPVTGVESNELNDVYKLFKDQSVNIESSRENIRFVDAITASLKESMRKHSNLVLLGQDIADYGGVFKITEGFLEEFGEKRVRNTPICESGVIEAGMGLSINGMKAMVELQFADFVSSGFNPVVNYLAKSYYRWNQNADVVLRMPCGAGVGAGPFHSQTNEAWFTKTPGLKVIYPAFPKDAKGLLNTAFNDPNPVLFFEHKALYRSIRQEVPTEYFTIPFGEASLLREGNTLSIITYGAPVHWTLEALEEFPELEVDLLDLRSLQPLDKESIIKSVRKTGKVLIITEDTLFGSVASDISAMIAEECFEYLDAPVARLGSLETPVPFAAALENLYLAKSKIVGKIKEIVLF